MKTLLMFIALAMVVVPANSQNKKKQDLEAIKSMCGCFEVQFNFAETFASDEDYKFHSNYRSGAIEYIVPVEESKDKIVLQHILVIGGDRIVKHWRQDWLYQNTELYQFQVANTWNYVSLNSAQVDGQWLQRVYQVDDSPRYGGSASWVHVDGRHYWESTADAPLPRREYTKRDDYNVTRRRNRQEITDYGWVHEQDNDKIIRDSTGDHLLAQEKGWNTYTKVEEEKCVPAVDWWNQQQQYWADVRSVWDELFDTRQTLKLKPKADDKFLYQQLFGLGDKLAASETYESSAAKVEIREVIEKYLEGRARFASIN